jgi:hypothetical protein
MWSSQLSGRLWRATLSVKGAFPLSPRCRLRTTPGAPGKFTQRRLAFHCLTVIIKLSGRQRPARSQWDEPICMQTQKSGARPPGRRADVGFDNSFTLVAFLPPTARRRKKSSICSSACHPSTAYRRRTGSAPPAAQTIPPPSRPRCRRGFIGSPNPESLHALHASHLMHHVSIFMTTP